MNLQSIILLLFILMSAVAAVRYMLKHGTSCGTCSGHCNKECKKYEKCEDR